MDEEDQGGCTRHGRMEKTQMNRQIKKTQTDEEHQDGQRKKTQTDT